MTIHEAQQQLLFQLYHIYNNREAANIADWVLEHLTGWKKIDRIVNKQVPLLPAKVALLQTYTAALLQHTPVQYVLHEAWFQGMPLYVDEHVLIPRPETEELVQWIVEETSGLKQQQETVTILDVGTGSGCIPIALKKKLPQAVVYACDVSAGALAVARKNAAAQQTSIHFQQLDFLQSASWNTLPDVDLLVSNPPYIPLKDKATMHANVLQYEPHLALFVENDDPLLFYKALAQFATTKLLPGGAVYAEIHEDLGQETKALFETHYFTVELKQDMQGKDRIIRACR